MPYTIAHFERNSAETYRYVTTHNIPNRQISNPPWDSNPQTQQDIARRTYALDRTVNGIVQVTICVQQITDTCLDIQYSPSYLFSDKWQTIRKPTFMYLH